VVKLGYALSSEEHSPRALVENAARAEAAGFTFALISDHFHPWVDAQGSSPFVWSVLGGIACTTSDLVVGTGVTCPLIRTHPVVIAHAAATVASMMPGRFFLGVGTGENLNEHITGARWPAIDERLDMLEEAVSMIRELWTGDDVTSRGHYYTVEQARIYNRPDPVPPIHMAASGDSAARVAARIADGFIGTSPKKEIVDEFKTNAGGANKPRYGQLTVCWAADEEEARRIAHEWWPNAAIGGELGQELPLPRHFEQAAKNVSADDVAEAVTCGPDAEEHIAAIERYIEAGYDHVYIHQVGPEQEGFFRFYEEQIIPVLRDRAAA
jgi:coenzyme F420-dependent glucose-6-phosphate dehydrogenase